MRSIQAATLGEVRATPLHPEAPDGIWTLLQARWTTVCPPLLCERASSALQVWATCKRHLVYKLQLYQSLLWPYIPPVTWEKSTFSCLPGGTGPYCYSHTSKRGL